MEQLDYNLLFRWFVGLNMDDAVWDASTFSKNRERLLEGDVARVFFDQVLAQARERALLSDEHFTVDGTLLEAWAGQKSFRRKAAEPPAPLMIPAPPAWTSMGNGAPTLPRPPSPIQRPVCTRRPKGRRLNSATWGIRSWRITMAW